MKPRSILKKQESSSEEKCQLEPFVVNIPDNISRIDIDQYLKNVQDQRRRGLNYSYNTDDENGEIDDDDENNESQETENKTNEPWTEVSILLFLILLKFLFLNSAQTLAFIIR